MVNGLILFLASLKSKKIITIAILVFWLTFMLIRSDFNVDIGFTMINFGVVLSITYLIRKIKKGNLLLAPFSVLLYSIIIDIICYFMFPSFSIGINIFVYIYNGILFNYRPFFLNSIVALMIVIVKDKAILHKSNVYKTPFYLPEIQL